MQNQTNCHSNTKKKKKHNNFNAIDADKPQNIAKIVFVKE